MANDWSKKNSLLPSALLPPNARSQGIQGIPSDWWFSPLQPVAPVAPSTYRPRQYAYQPGANLTWQPKGDGFAIGFEALRTFADSWDLLRMVIETRKDRLCGVQYELRVKPVDGETNADRKARSAKDATLKALQNFFEYPDGIHPFKRWLRLWLEDMLVLDAVALYAVRDGDAEIVENSYKIEGKTVSSKQKKQSGKIAYWQVLAGDTINRMLSETGMTPQPPSVAYQQVVYGAPAFDFTTDDLVYSMRNERTNKRYGFSRVEQLITTIAIGIRADEFMLAGYTQGNMPEAMVFLPSDLPIDRVKEVQEWFDSQFAGDLEQRRKLTFLPGYGTGDAAKPNVVFPKESLITDKETQEWLVNRVCYAFSESKQSLTKMMNRASAEEANDAATEEGLTPDAMYVIEVLNTLLAIMGVSDQYEWSLRDHREIDVLKQAQADAVIVGKITTINELREARGLDPRSEPEANQLGVFTATGFIPLGQTAASMAPQQQDDGSDDDPKNAKNPKNGKPTADKKKNDEKPSLDKKKQQSSKAQKMQKSASQLRQRCVIDLHKSSAVSVRARKRLQTSLTKFFDKTSTDIVSRLRKQGSELKKAQPLSQKQTLNIVLDIDWSELPDDLLPDLMTIASTYGAAGLAQLDLDDADLIDAVNATARDWAEERAAELVGMKYVDGALVVNPDAKWAISETTRDDLRRIVTQAFEKETSIDELAKAIQDAGTFAESRADMIATTEAARAQVIGNLTGWKESGVVETVEVLLSADHDQDDECDEAAEGGPYPIDEAPEVPLHPRCMCGLRAVKIKTSDDEGEA